MVPHRCRLHNAPTKYCAILPNLLQTLTTSIGYVVLQYNKPPTPPAQSNSLVVSSDRGLPFAKNLRVASLKPRGLKIDEISINSPIQQPEMILTKV